jgi:palmitoyltransferase
MWLWFDWELYFVFIVFLYFRNQSMKVLFGILVVGGNIIYIIDMLPLLYKYQPDQNHTLIPILNMFVNLYFFHKCCSDDPGEITLTNLERYKSVYQYDGKLYIPNTKCRTCHFVKPARSKHCSKLYYKTFDPDCTWLILSTE